jgi:hypothetical protein
MFKTFGMFRSRLLAGAVSFIPALVAAFALSGLLASPAQAQLGNVSTVTAISESKATAFPATAWYTSTAEGVLYGDWKTADVFLASTSVSGTVYMTATPQYSADGVLWSNADERVISGTTASNVAFSLNLAPTGDAAEHLRVPFVGQYLRVLLTVSGDVDPSVKVTLRE